MQSRLKAGRAPAHPTATPHVEADLIWYQRWLGLDDHRLRLLDAWCELTWLLERQDGWFALSDAERAELERTTGISALDINLRLIDRRLRRWLRALPTRSTDDIAVVAASLAVAQRLLPPEENRVVHGVIARAVRDLSRIKDLS